MRRPAIALWLTVAIAAGAGTLVVHARSADPAATAPRSAAAPPMQMLVEIGGSATPVIDGEPIAVARGVTARLALLTAGRGQHTLQVRLEDDTGTPITDATLEAIVQMRFMEHGRATFVGLPAGASGSYVVPIGFEMPGQWRIDLRVAGRSTTGVVHLEVDEFR